MLLNTFTEQELVQESRTHIGSLERWLRRLVSDQLIPEYGEDFLSKNDSAGNTILSSQRIRDIKARIEKNPGRYAREIDAALIDDLQSIICKEAIFKAHFSQVFKPFFSDIGIPHIRHILTRLIDIRNKLSHENAISVREVEQSICYSNDVVDALKEFYKSVNQSSEYNCPTILRLWDSLGNVFYTGSRDENPKQASFNTDGYKYLRPGDSLTVELEIDPSFPANTYDVQWVGRGVNFSGIGSQYNRIQFLITNEHVAKHFLMDCRIISHQDYHRHGYYDDYLMLSYSIRPPLRSS